MRRPSPGPAPSVREAPNLTRGPGRPQQPATRPVQAPTSGFAPRPVTLRTAECGIENAFYDGEAGEIIFCYELAELYYILYYLEDFVE